MAENPNQQTEITLHNATVSLALQQPALQGKNLHLIVTASNNKVIFPQKNKSGNSYIFKGPQKISLKEEIGIGFTLVDKSQESQQVIFNYQTNSKEFNRKENQVQFKVNAQSNIKIQYSCKVLAYNNQEKQSSEEKKQNQNVGKDQSTMKAQEIEKNEQSLQNQRQTMKEKSQKVIGKNQQQNRTPQSHQQQINKSDQQNGKEQNQQIENLTNLTEKEVKRKTERSKKASETEIATHLKKQSQSNIKHNQSQHPLNTHQQQESTLKNQNSFASRSRNTFKLPNIGQQSRNFGDRIFDKQSSSTLQKSILVYSMPKAPRFGSGPKYSGQLSYYVDTCFKPNSTKGVGFGFGSKRQFPQWMEKNMKENPSPGAYFQAGRRTEFRSRGPTFGISHKYYEKVTIPKQSSREKSFLNKSNQRLKPLLRK